MNRDEAFLKRLLATFMVEAAEHIAAISAGLVEMEKAASAERQTEIIESVFRETHSMKGAARSVNLTSFEAVCQSFEGVLAALKRRDIAPDRTLLDLLHRTVNLLGELLSTLKEKGTLADKSWTRGLLQELDSAGRKAPPAGSPAAGEQIPGEHAPLTRGEKHPPAAPVPGTLLATAETVRVSKQKLDAILLQAEEFLSIKQASGQRIRELGEIAALASGLNKELAKIRSEMRAVLSLGNKDRAVTAISDRTASTLLDSLASGGEHLSQLDQTVGAFGRALEQDRRSITGLVDGLLDDVKTIYMLPFSSLMEVMPKVVRDLTHDRSKEAVLRTSGEEIKIDRRILDEMREPLIHLIRNCVDHGIEKLEERVAKKKRPIGTIGIDVVQKEGNAVEILVSDDGAGVDIREIGRSAVELGVLSKEDADGMDEQKLLRLMFRSGVSTSPMITELSGRGLGLAIVQERVERLGGSLFCETAAGKGTSFRILLPLTLATFRGLLVQTEDRLVIVPLTGLDRTVRFEKKQIKTVENKKTILLGEQTVPLIPLGKVLELSQKGRKDTEAGTVLAVVLGTDENRIAFTVDDILHEQEVLVKNFGPQLARVRNIAGVTMLGTGQIVPVLNVSDLLKSAVKGPTLAERVPVAEETGRQRKSVLVVEDSITARSLLKNILETAGYAVKSAVDGIDAFMMLRAEDFDLVVSDVDMPRMNGFELTTKIRSDKRLAELPVILVTALDSREDRERGIDVGANAYIVKGSFDQSNLLEVIKRLI